LAKFKKTDHVTLTTPMKGQSVIPRLAFDIFYMHAKCCDSRCSRSGDMIAGIETENGSCDPGLIIGQYLANVWAKIEWHLFVQTRCSVQNSAVLRRQLL